MKVKLLQFELHTKAMICYNSHSPNDLEGWMCSSTIKLMFNQIFSIFKHCLDSDFP